MSESLATYSEYRILRKRRFTLTPGTLTIEVKAIFGPSGVFTIDLSGVDSSPDTIFVRNEVQSGTWFLGIVIALLGGFIAMQATWGYRPEIAIPWLIACILAVILNVIFARRIEYRRYKFSSTPGAIAFDVGRVGAGAQDFDGFLETVEDEIRNNPKS